MKYRILEAGKLYNPALKKEFDIVNKEKNSMAYRYFVRALKDAKRVNDTKEIAWLKELCGSWATFKQAAADVGVN